MAIFPQGLTDIDKRCANGRPDRQKCFLGRPDRDGRRAESGADSGAGLAGPGQRARRAQLVEFFAGRGGLVCQGDGHRRDGGAGGQGAEGLRLLSRSVAADVRPGPTTGFCLSGLGTLSQTWLITMPTKPCSIG